MGPTERRQRMFIACFQFLCSRLKHAARFSMPGRVFGCNRASTHKMFSSVRSPAPALGIEKMVLWELLSVSVSS